MITVQYVWESLKTVNEVVDVFETCIDFGLNSLHQKRLPQNGS